MSYVNCARHVREQNLMIIQKDSEIFYDVARDIAVGSELLVWYGEAYIQFMGIPITLPTSIENTTEAECEKPSE